MKSYQMNGHTIVQLPGGKCLVHKGLFKPGDDFGPIVHEATSLENARQWVGAADGKST